MRRMGVNARKGVGLRAFLAASVALASLMIASQAKAQAPKPPGASNTPSVAGAAEAGAVNLDEISVEARSPTFGTTGFVATRSTAGMKSNASILETPATVSVITRDELDVRGVQDLNLATAYTPNVTALDYPGGQGAPTFTLRGFNAINFENVYEDGLRYGFNIYDQNVEPYAYERIDVIKGPLSVLYGAGQPGGIINLISKRPSFVRSNEVFIQGGSFNRVQGGFDLTGPVEGNEQFAYRITGLVRQSDTQVAGSPDDRIYISPAITWKPDADTSLTVLAKYANYRRGGSEQSLPVIGTIVPSSFGFIKRDLFVGQPNLNEELLDNRSISYLLDHSFAPGWIFHSAFRYLETDSKYQATALSFPVSESLLSTTPYIRNQNSRAILADNHIEGRFETGLLQHNIVLGVDYQNYVRRNRQFLGQDDFILDLYNPVYPTTINIPMTQFGLIQRQSVQQVGLYGQDQIKAGGFILTGSLRNDFFDSQVTSTSDFAPVLPVATQSLSALSYRGALGYEFDSGIVPYVSYATSFNPQVGGTTRTGTQLGPNEANQIEGGVKYQPPGVNALFTASYFEITQTNIARPDPTFIGALIATGEATSKGFEIEGKITLDSGVSFIAGYTHLDTRVTKDTTLAIGSRLPNAPENALSLFADYAFPAGSILGGLRAGGGVRYVGSRTDATNRDFLPSYVLVDASISYDLSYIDPRLKGATAAITGTNLFDERYFSPAFQQNFVREGFRRNVLGTLTYRW